MKNNRILRDKEEAKEAYQRLQQKLSEEQIKLDIKTINQQETKYKTSFEIEISITQELEKRLTPILIEYGFIIENNKIIYVGKIPARIIKENKLQVADYLKSYQTVLFVNKKKGMTSFDVVKKISQIYGIKKVGHTGTLDPMAEGVLLVTIGPATKIAELLTAEEKEYIAGVKLGIKTDTYDSTGTILETTPVPEDLPIEEVLKTFQKTYLQEVPIYSAVKVNGKKCYEYARNNQDVVLPKKEVTIKKIELLNKEKDEFVIKTLVSKGCYIRSLIKEIGEELNTNAIMTSLTRTKQGSISIEETYDLEEISQGVFTSHEIEEVLNIPIIEVKDQEEFKCSNGVKIKDRWNIKEKVIIHGKEKKRIGIYEKQGDYLVPWKNFI